MISSAPPLVHPSLRDKFFSSNPEIRALALTLTYEENSKYPRAMRRSISTGFWS
jgi:hypothetical protein